MFKRSNANYSLWPEQARPRRGMSISLAAGGFAVGIVCAIAAVNVASDFVRPVAMEPELVQNPEPSRPIPVYSASSALTAEKPAEPSEGDTTRSRTRSAAKVALPMIGRAVPVVSETDGSGRDSAVKSRSGDPTGNADADAKLTRNDSKLLREDTPALSGESKVAAHAPAPRAAEPQASEAAAAQPEAVKRASAKKRSAYRRAKPRRTKEARRPERRRPTYAAPYRAGPTYGYSGAPVYGYYHY